MSEATPIPTSKPTPTAATAPPEAVVVRARRFSFAWLAPVLALLVAGALLYNALQDRGPIVTIRFSSGHDLKPNDPISHRGVQIGKVRSIRLGPDLRHVIVAVALTRDAAPVAREGTEFWIVRPQLSLTQIAGVETLLGPRYIAVRPGEGPPKRQFVGLDEPPVAFGLTGDGLVIVLETGRAGSIQIGSPVLYRDVQVGAVTDTRLSDDASVVEVVAEISPQYASLVRANSRFWKVGGIGMDLGFSGLSLQADSLAALIQGGIGFATPNRPAEPVAAGHRFDLADRPDADWLKWSPALPTAAAP